MKNILKNEIIQNFIVIIIAVIISLFLLKFILPNNSLAYEYENTVSYYVESGDTLWVIARNYSSNRQDVREVISIIEKINNCTACIQPGDKLEIPVFINMGDR